ncbi:hypothetical protein Tco_1270252 [Tanacetum coccineum]
MTTPFPTPFPVTTPRAGVFAPFVIISDSDDEITTLPVRPAPPSPDHIPDLHGYPLDSGDDLSDEDLSETTMSLHTQTALTSVVHPPPTRPLPTSHTFARLPGKEISMPLGYRAAMERWRAASLSTTSIRDTIIIITTITLDIIIFTTTITFTILETMTFHARVGSLEQHDVVTRESLRIARGRFEMAELQSREQDIEASF